MIVIWGKVAQDTFNKVFTPILEQYTIQVSVQNVDWPVATSDDVVLACGAKNVSVLQSKGLLPKNRTIPSLREKPLYIEGVPFLVTFDPSIIFRDYSHLPELQWDITLALRIHFTGSTVPITGEYKWDTDFNEIVETVYERYEETKLPVPIACDLETLGLDEFNPEAWIISIAISVTEGKSSLIYFNKGQLPEKGTDDEPGLWDQINWLMTTDLVVTRGANFKFDSRWMAEKWGIFAANCKFDTVLGGSVLDENRSNSLKLHAKIYTPIGGYEDGIDRYDKGRMDLIPKDELLVYAGGDTDATLRISNVMRETILKDGQLSNFYAKIVHPASKVFEKMERSGVVVDVEYYKQLQNDLITEAERLHGLMVGMIPRKLRLKYSDNLSITRAAILKDFLFTDRGLGLKPKMVTEKTQEPSTAMEHLSQFIDDPVAKDFITLYKDFITTNKTLSTYVNGFMAYIKPDGRFHPTYMLHRGDYGGGDSGTVTGRTSCKDPAMQTIPKHTKYTKLLRRAFIAPVGYEILEVDYSQGELKITACLAEEPEMIRAYKEGADLHSITAAKLNGYSLEDFNQLPPEIRDELRSGGKAGNFGLIYGMGAAGFQIYAWNSYGVRLTAAEAIGQREAFFSLYRGLPKWHEKYRSMARRDGYVRSPLGRVRHLPLIGSKDSEIASKQERQAINSPVQSCLSDMMQYSMVILDRMYGDQIQMFLMTHDSLAMYVPQGEGVEWAKKVSDVMGNLPLKQNFGWDHQLQFTVDAALSSGVDGVHSLASMSKVKGI